MPYSRLVCPFISLCHCVKNAQIYGVNLWSEYQSEYGNLVRAFSPNMRKYEPEKTPYLDTFHTVCTHFRDFPDTKK